MKVDSKVQVGNTSEKFYLSRLANNNTWYDKTELQLQVSMHFKETDLAHKSTTSTIDIEKDFCNDREQFRNIVPLAPVLLEKPLVKLIKGGEPERHPGPIKLQRYFCHNALHVSNCYGTKYAVLNVCKHPPRARGGRARGRLLHNCERAIRHRTVACTTVY